MMSNAAFTRALLNTQRALMREAEGLGTYADRRGFVLSQGLENDLREHAADMESQADVPAYLLNQYLDECEGAKGGAA